jgi:hypothetical protein
VISLGECALICNPRGGVKLLTARETNGMAEETNPPSAINTRPWAGLLVVVVCVCVCVCVNHAQSDNPFQTGTRPLVEGE